MSISEGDTVILPHGVVGYLHKTRLGTLRVEGEGGAVWDGYDKDDLICADDPLRVLVDTEQQAREVYDLAVGDWESLEPYKREKLISRAESFEFDPHKLNFSTPNLKSKPLAQDVDFLERRSQVRKYISYHSEEETMSDDHPDQTDEDELTHDLKRKVAWKRGMNKTRCDYCDEWIHNKQWDKECPDRQREDDDDGEVDVRREVAKRFLEGENPPSITQDVEWSAALVLEAIREHCELSDGVSCSTCGYDLTGEPDHHYHTCQNCSDTVCDGCVVRRDASTEVDPNRREILCQDCDGIYDLKQEIRDLKDDDEGVCEWTKTEQVADGGGGMLWLYQPDHEVGHEFPVTDMEMKYCPWCKGEITADEGGGKSYQVGSLYENDSGYSFVIDGTPMLKCSNGSTVQGYPKGEKVGEFAPDDGALERVNPECNGSLFIADNQVLFDPCCRTEDIPPVSTDILYTDQWHGYQVQGAEATEIVLESFHQIAEE